ncbi:glucose uptake protein [Anseongella ginsenosidimutans]|uniref:Glucose uptake protein n=1 Tax=Anseongella ginsenosidimutans TaxID=496056 RepID=A0A4R3KX35_9SPHI|nr:GRP family sugar transporter [Anseongella ginsenosidimutans]QEC51328.1 multidrug DMT transporter permease [Anseongella ginsenosidimutans]TCS89978.1 glucose uptake protein [Anseongella ginsenosidimutans]
MFIVENYALAVICCLITMLCWGSWANTQKLVGKEWRFELFYWDYVLGILLLAIIGAFTLGSTGESGRPFLEDIAQAHPDNIRTAVIGGVVFNLANILLTAAIAGAGMAVAFPIGIGLALVIGVVLNYYLASKGDPLLLFAGVALVVLAIILNAVAYSKHSGKAGKKEVGKWILIAIVAGGLMSTFYPFIAAGMELENFREPAAGKMTPYTAFVIFAAGIVASNLVFNTVLMRKPLEGAPISYAAYFKGRLGLHFVGILGGCIWGLGNLFNLIAAGKAGPAISYGLGQGATLVAALWGVLIWKEFKGASKSVNQLIAGMFLLFVLGLGLIIAAGK